MRVFFISLVLVMSSPTNATDMTVEVHLIDETGIGKPIGKISLADGREGLVLTPALEGLTPGAHGFHVHENPDCRAKDKGGKVGAGLAAGPHYDPDQTGRHEGPSGQGHRGDLAMLVVGSDGIAQTAVSAPRLKLADLLGRSLVIHAEADNYADKPGGARMACGVVSR